MGFEPLSSTTSRLIEFGFLRCRTFGYGSDCLFVVYGDVDEAGGEVELCPGWCLSDSRDSGFSLYGNASMFL